MEGDDYLAFSQKCSIIISISIFLLGVLCVFGGSRKLSKIRRLGAVKSEYIVEEVGEWHRVLEYGNMDKMPFYVTCAEVKFSYSYECEGVKYSGRMILEVGEEFKDNIVEGLHNLYKMYADMGGSGRVAFIRRKDLNAGRILYCMGLFMCVVGVLLT